MANKLFDIKNNFSATVDPSVTNDSSQYYSGGSFWFNTTTRQMFLCRSSAAGAAVWERIDNFRSNMTATTNPTATDDGSGTNPYEVGSMWYNTTTKKLYRCTDSTTGAAVWQQDNAAGNGTKTFDLFEEFMTITSPYGSDMTNQSAGAGSGITAVSSASNAALGIAQYNTGTTNTGRAGVASSILTNMVAGVGKLTFIQRSRLPTLSTVTETYTVRIGFITSTAGESTDGAFFRYTDAVNSGRWQAVTRNNSTETANDTGVAVTASSTVWDKFEIEINAAGTSVVFKINSTVVATISTNIPATNRAFSFGSFIIKSVGTTTRTQQVDYIGTSGEFTTDR